MKVSMTILASLLAAGLVASPARAQSALEAGAADNPLPAGHPPMEKPTGPVEPGRGTGTIHLKAIQGTKNGPAIGADRVLIEYFDAQQQVAGKTETTLNGQGELKIEKIPLATVVQPLVTVTHGGAKYQAVGKVMNLRAPEQRIDVTVFETTDKEPDWQIRMRHVIVDTSPAGLVVTEMISVFNESDRTWLGKPRSQGEPVTVSLPLPAGATHVAPSEGGEFQDGKAVWAVPMLPGAMELQVKYVLMAKDGTAEVMLTSPAATKSLLVFLPDDGSGFVGEKFQRMQPRPGSNLKEDSRFFTAPPQNAGEQLKFAVTNLQNVLPAAAQKGEVTVTKVSGVSTVAKVIGGIAAGLILAVGMVWVMLKPKPRAASGK